MTDIRATLAFICMLCSTIACALDVSYSETGTYIFSASEKLAVETIAASTELEVRQLLPGLPSALTLEVREGNDVSPNTGHGAQVLGPGVIGFTVDASRAEGAESIIQAQLRSTLFHELHHVVRGTPMSFMDTVISEGMATVFARDSAGAATPWSDYSGEVADWTDEIRNLKPGFNYSEWMFSHPDGRRWIGYAVGTYLVDLAVAASGKTAAELATTSTGEILELADSLSPN